MQADIVFIAISLLAAASAIALFASRRLLHAVLALTIAFMSSSLLFFYLGETFIALLQLFVFVGGLSTYLVVAVAAEAARGKFELYVFIPLAVLFVIGLSEIVINSNLSLPAPALPASFTGASIEALTVYYPVLAMLLILLFSAVIGSILIIRKFVRLVT